MNSMRKLTPLVITLFITTYFFTFIPPVECQLPSYAPVPFNEFSQAAMSPVVICGRRTIAGRKSIGKAYRKSDLEYSASLIRDGVHFLSRWFSDLKNKSMPSRETLETKLVISKPTLRKYLPQIMEAAKRSKNKRLSDIADQWMKRRALKEQPITIEMAADIVMSLIEKKPERFPSVPEIAKELQIATDRMLAHMPAILGHLKMRADNALEALIQNRGHVAAGQTRKKRRTTSSTSPIKQSWAIEIPQSRLSVSKVAAYDVYLDKWTLSHSPNHQMRITSFTLQTLENGSLMVSGRTTDHRRIVLPTLTIKLNGQVTGLVIGHSISENLFQLIETQAIERNVKELTISDITPSEDGFFLVGKRYRPLGGEKTIEGSFILTKSGFKPWRWAAQDSVPLREIRYPIVEISTDDIDQIYVWDFLSVEQKKSLLAALRQTPIAYVRNIWGGVHYKDAQAITQHPIVPVLTLPWVCANRYLDAPLSFGVPIAIEYQNPVDSLGIERVALTLVEVNGRPVHAFWREIRWKTLERFGEDVVLKYVAEGWHLKPQSIVVEPVDGPGYELHVRHNQLLRAYGPNGNIHALSLSHKMNGVVAQWVSDVRALVQNKSQKVPKPLYITDLTQSDNRLTSEHRLRLGQFDVPVPRDFIGGELFLQAYRKGGLVMFRLESRNGSTRRAHFYWNNKSGHVVRFRGPVGYLQETLPSKTSNKELPLMPWAQIHDPRDIGPQMLLIMEEQRRLLRMLSLGDHVDPILLKVLSWCLEGREESDMAKDLGIGVSEVDAMISELGDILRERLEMYISVHQRRERQPRQMGRFAVTTKAA